MENDRILEVVNEIKISKSVAINLLKDMVGDYKKICKKQWIIITTFAISNILLTLYIVFSIL